jgi:DDE superfamily endonuclease
MLPGLTVPPSLLALLQVLRPCFTAPTFRTFSALVTGLIAANRRRTVVGMLLGAGLTHLWPHDRAHYFFARARWSTDQLGLALARLIAQRLLPQDAALHVAVDDTLFKRRGKKVYGAAWQHDGSATGAKKTGFGNNWVVLGLLVPLPFLDRPVCLPVLARLWRPGSEASKVELARQLVGLLLSAFPARELCLVGDAAYHGKALRDLPERCSWTCRMQRNGVFYAPAPPPTGRRGHPRWKGERLGTPGEIAAATAFTRATVQRYGRTETVRLAVVAGLWWGAFHRRACRLILIRDEGSDKVYDLALVTTDLSADPAAVVSRYAWRWQIELLFLQVKQILGVGQARNRVQRAVERTVPFGLAVYTLTVIWYALHGRHEADLARRRTREPWLTGKTTVSFEDMHQALRHEVLEHRITHVIAAHNPTQQIRQALRELLGLAA